MLFSNKSYSMKIILQRQFNTHTGLPKDDLVGQLTWLVLLILQQGELQQQHE